jgi:hypothetical protein
VDVRKTHTALHVERPFQPAWLVTLVTFVALGARAVLRFRA